MGTENEEELYKREQALEGERQRQAAAERARQLEAFQKAEAERKAAEEAAKKQGNMVADPGVGAGWPDGEVQATQTGLDKVAGALGVGHAGDVALAHKLLTGGQTPLGSVSAPAQSAGGTKESTAEPRAAKPALGLG